MEAATETTLFIGIKGTVLALDRMTGQELWRTKLKGSSFVNLTLDGDEIFASTRGELFCLDAYTGIQRWNNPLRGMGYGIVTFAQESNQAAIAEDEHQREQAARNSIND